MQDGVADIPWKMEKILHQVRSVVYSTIYHGFFIHVDGGSRTINSYLFRQKLSISWPRPTTGSLSLVEIPLVELLGPTVVFFSPGECPGWRFDHSCLAWICFQIGTDLRKTAKTGPILKVSQFLFGLISFWELVSFWTINSVWDAHTETYHSTFPLWTSGEVNQFIASKMKSSFCCQSRCDVTRKTLLLLVL